MRRVLREPLLPFAVLGAVLVVADAFVRRDDPETAEIVVSGNQLALRELRPKANP